MAQQIVLGPKARAVMDATMTEIASQIGPVLEDVISRICTAAGYQDKQGATSQVIASLPAAVTPVSGAVTPGLRYQQQPPGGPYPPLPPPATYTPPVPALPPAGGGCSTGSCGIKSATPQHRNGGNQMSQKPCCGSCAIGGQCSCSAESLGCATGDTVNKTGSFQAQDPATGAPVNASCVLPPGFDNCLSHAGDLAPCDVDRIQRTRRRFVVQDDNDSGTLEDATTVLETELDTPAGYSWYRLRVPEVDVSHQICPREFQLELNDDPAGAGTYTDVSGTIEEVALQTERIFADGDGNFVHGWSFPRPADPDDLKITDNRCACERLCDCNTYYGDAAISVLAPTLGVGEAYRLTVKGIRDCWKIVCGACPPDDLCGREIIS